MKFSSTPGTCIGYTATMNGTILSSWEQFEQEITAYLGNNCISIFTLPEEEASRKVIMSDPYGIITTHETEDGVCVHFFNGKLLYEKAQKKFNDTVQKYIDNGKKLLKLRPLRVGDRVCYEYNGTYKNFTWWNKGERCIVTSIGTPGYPNYIKWSYNKAEYGPHPPQYVTPVISDEELAIAIEELKNGTK